jgi:hypothetical protein
MLNFKHLCAVFDNSKEEKSSPKVLIDDNNLIREIKKSKKEEIS